MNELIDRDPVYEFHGDPRPGALRQVGFSGAVHVGDGGVLQPAKDFRLQFKTGQLAGVIHPAEHFQGDRTVGFGLLGFIDDAHAAHPNPALDRVRPDTVRNGSRVDKRPDIHAGLDVQGDLGEAFRFGLVGLEHLLYQLKHLGIALAGVPQEGASLVLW